MLMIYRLTSIPDISLSKYQIMAKKGIEQLRELSDGFLRQWQRISSIYDIEINYLVKYIPWNNSGEKLELYIVFNFNNNELQGYLRDLMDSSQLSDIYKIVRVEESEFINNSYKEKILLKKCERQRCTDSADGNKIDLYYVETWESNKNSRLIDFYKAIEKINSEIVYRVTLRGVDAYEDIYASLEKPIKY